MPRSTVMGLAGAATLVALATACLPPPPPPTYTHAPPVIESVTVTPAPVVAGAPLTITVVADHESAVTSVDTTVSGPTHYELPASYGCNAPEHQQWSGPTTHVTVSLTCTMPAIAGNGQWLAHVTVHGDDSASTDSSVPFQVTGGSNDTYAPWELSYSSMPTIVHPGSDVALTVRLQEDHLPIAVTGVWDWFTSDDVLGPSHITCDDHPVFAPVDYRTVDMTVTCHIAADTKPGTYSGPSLYTSDPLGQQGNVGWTVTVVA